MGGALTWERSFTVDGWFFVDELDDALTTWRPLFVWGAGSEPAVEMAYNEALGRVALAWGSTRRYHPMMGFSGWTHFGLSYDHLLQTVTMAVDGQGYTLEAPVFFLADREDSWLGLGGGGLGDQPWGGGMDSARVSRSAHYAGALVFTPSPQPEVRPEDEGVWRFDRNLDNAAAAAAAPLTAINDVQRYLDICPE